MLIHLLDLRRSGWQVQSAAAEREPKIDVGGAGRARFGKERSAFIAEAERARQD